MQSFRTFPDCCHTTRNAIDHTQGLGTSHPRLFLGQSIQSLQDSLYLALPQQLQRKFLCGTLSQLQCICDSGLTEPAQLDLFSGQGKHRKQFNHYFNDDIRDDRSERDCRIDLQTLEEIPQTLEKIEQGVVTRRNPTCSLERSYVTGEQLEEHIQGTYIKKCIDPSKQQACWWERGLRGLVKISVG